MEISKLTKQLEALKESFLAGLKPPPDMTVTEWADTYRQLPQESSGEPGPYRTSRVPYVKEVLYELSPCSKTETVVVIKGSQVGFSEVGINWLSYIVDQAPAPTLMVQPTDKLSARFSKQRISPSFNLMPSVAAKVSENKSRGKGNTILQKDFKGGTIIMGGANSAASLRSMPIRNLFCDEIDAYPLDADGEGDPLELAIKRTTNFSNKKKFFISTPTLENYSRIEAYFKKSDQRYYYVPCPLCNHKQVITWQHLKYDDNDPKTVRMVCEHCKGEIKEHSKTWMLENGEWRKHNPTSEIAGFHLSALYSPLGWYSWKDCVTEFIAAIGSPVKRKVWVNTVLGEVWKESESTISAHWLESRKERYIAEVPKEVLVLTCGIDTQDDRLEAQVIGWGLNQESWVIEHKILTGDPGMAAVWEELNLFLQKQYQHENGKKISVAASCQDILGHHTKNVYAFCKKYQWRKNFAAHGISRPGMQIVHKFTVNKNHGVFLFQIGVDQAKEDIYVRLKQGKPGPGFVHFPEELHSTFYTQLTAEERKPKMVKGIPRLVWTIAQNKRNEALDCNVMALAAFTILKPNLELLAKQNLIYTGIRSPFANTAPTGRRVISKGA